MTIQFSTAALAHRIAVLDEIGVGPLWLRRDAVFEAAMPSPQSSPSAQSETAMQSAPLAHKENVAPDTRVARGVETRADDAAWDDNGPASVSDALAPIKTVVTLCTKSAIDAVGVADTTRYLFVTRASSVQGTEELFSNILLALELKKEAQAQGDLSSLTTQITSHIESHQSVVLILMEPAAALQLIDGDSAATFDSLRGHLHRVSAIPAMPAIQALVTYGPAHLLRNPGDKRKAWDDLCLLTALRTGDVVDPA